MSHSLRIPAFCLSVFLFLGITLTAGLTDSLAKDADRLIPACLAMSAAGLAVWAFFPDLMGHRGSVLLIVGLAIAGRLLMYDFPPSDDVNRYLWEGKLLLEGESPYAATADTEAWAGYRDRYWEGMNHKDKLTAYPPIALMVFAGLNLISYNVWIYKLFFGLLDLATLGVLIRILRLRQLPVRTSLIYALNPVTLVSFAGEAHYDSLFVFLVMAALMLREKGKISSAWILLGLSIQVKLISVLLVPLFFWKHKSARVLWIVVPILAPCLFFFPDLPNLLKAVLHFGGSMSHNGSINQLFIDIFGSREIASKLSILSLTVVVLITSLKATDVLKGSFIIVGALILLSPTVHYWYLSWVLPFVVIFPSFPWLLLLALGAFYFSAWVQFGRSGEWYQPIGYLCLQWIPFYILWVPMFIKRLRSFCRVKSWSAESLSVVIPTLNEGANLPACLQSLQATGMGFKEVIIVDGGSTDNGASIAATHSVRFLSSKKGRGGQIATGVRVCRGDVVLVLHADARLKRDTPKKILATLKANPEAVGGAAGQRFFSTEPKAVLLIIEVLNDFRAQWMGNSFGDQGQFFRREVLESLGGFPDIPLMEDVELTAQLKRSGHLLLLDNGLKCSARRWVREQAISRIIQVLSLVIRYKILRLLGKNPAKKLFEEYYPK